MKIGIIGASGKAGNHILNEAVARGHNVTAIVRNASKMTNENVEVVQKDIHELSSEDLSPYEVVVNAFGAPIGEEEAHVTAGQALINALKGTNTRAIIVGGAGSLYVDENQTTQVIDTPDFPDVVKPTAKGQGRNLEDLQQSQNITWTFISPSAIFDSEGLKTGTYQVGKDNLLVNSNGNSYISYADYALAVVDEIEHPRYLNSRFTVVGD
ncbi:NAD(P)-dependent oxidoreductase [Virgibacillus necropolis]|uniref:NAD(P)-dependent oxidoreductase n=1 Tax=Virgibacillus necropolis TaxID=163877 RepID=UPI00384BD25F